VSRTPGTVSLLVGLECYTIQRPCISPSLIRCLETFDIIESPHPEARIQTLRVSHRQNGQIVTRWLNTPFTRTESRLKKIIGRRNLCSLEAILNDQLPSTGQVVV